MDDDYAQGYSYDSIRSTDPKISSDLFNFLRIYALRSLFKELKAQNFRLTKVKYLVEARIRSNLNPEIYSRKKKEKDEVVCEQTEFFKNECGGYRH